MIPWGSLKAFWARRQPARQIPEITARQKKKKKKEGSKNIPTLVKSGRARRTEKPTALPQTHRSENRQPKADTGHFLADLFFQLPLHLILVLLLSHKFNLPVGPSIPSAMLQRTRTLLTDLFTLLWTCSTPACVLAESNLTCGCTRSVFAYQISDRSSSPYASSVLVSANRYSYQAYPQPIRPASCVP